MLLLSLFSYGVLKFPLLHRKRCHTLVYVLLMTPNSSSRMITLFGNSFQNVLGDNVYDVYLLHSVHLPWDIDWGDGGDPECFLMNFIFIANL